VCSDPATLALQDHSEELKERFQKQALLMPAAYIFSALNLINESDVSYPQVRNKRLHIEITLTRICFLRRLQEGNPFAGEKKTADASDSITPPPAKPEKSRAKTPPVPTVQEAIPVIPKVAQIANEVPPADVTPEKKKAATRPPATPVPLKKIVDGTAVVGKIVLTTPQVSSLFDLKSHVEKNEKIAKDNSLELSEENAIYWWNEFRQTLSSPSVAVAFKEANVSLEDKVLKIVVDSLLARTRIQEENDLLIRFRHAFHDQGLDIQIVVEESDAAREARKPKRTLTVREKYEILLAKNPAMEELKNKLGLVVDHDE
jgi:DNA polymerase-3 subunit gamma/tau